MKTKQRRYRSKEEPETIDFLLNKSEETFNRNLSNMDKIDSKFVQLLIFISAIFFLFIKFISLPNNLPSMMVYIVIICCFFISLITAFLGYRTNKYKSIDINNLIKEYTKGNLNSSLDLKKSVAGTLAYRINYLKKINFRKGKYFDQSALFLILGILFTLLLNILEVSNV